MNWQEYYTNIEAEQSVLGIILKNPELIHESLLVTDDFTLKSHQIIYNAMIGLKDAGREIDTVLLSTRIGQEVMPEIGGFGYLVRLTESVPTTADFEIHQALVKEQSTMRITLFSLQELCRKRIKSPEEFAAELAIIHAEIGKRSTLADQFQHIRDGVMEHFEYMCDKADGKVSLGYATPGIDLDKIIGRYQKQTLNIVAARPSMGKTAFMLNGVRKNAHDGVTVAVYSLEQPKVQLYDRIISAEANINGHAIKTAKLTDEEWSKYTLALASLSEVDVYIDDRQGLTIQEIRSSARKLKQKHPELIIYIDYLQLIHSSIKRSNRNDEVGYISSELKQMARELDCPVVALGQLSRGVEQRQDKRPMMSDLRESGNIEQDADTITFLYRDDYYNAETEKRNIIECIVAKNREGKIGTAEMIFLKDFNKFLNYERVTSDMFTGG